MIAQQGQVVGLEGGEALVRIGGASGCPKCDAGEGCGAGVFGRLLRRKPVILHAPNLIGARVGDTVQLGISDRQFLTLVFRLYGSPLLAALLGAAAGHALAVTVGYERIGSDLLALVLAILAGAMALVWSRRRLKEFTPRSAVHLLRAVSADPQEHCSARAGFWTARRQEQDSIKR